MTRSILSTMGILTKWASADRLIGPLLRSPTFSWFNSEGRFVFADFARVRMQFPYITLTPQSQFLDLMEESRKLPSFQLIMNANAQDPIEEEGIVKGSLARTAPRRS